MKFQTDKRAQILLYKTRSLTISPYMRTETRIAGLEINLPHTISILTARSKNNTSSQILYLKVSFHVVACNFILVLFQCCRTYPFGTRPSFIHQSHLKIGHFIGCCFPSFVIPNRYAPIITRSSLQGRAIVRTIHTQTGFHLS